MRGVNGESGLGDMRKSKNAPEWDGTINITTVRADCRRGFAAG